VKIDDENLSVDNLLELCTHVEKCVLSEDNIEIEVLDGNGGDLGLENVRGFFLDFIREKFYWDFLF
jgi:hypothetical protein